MIFDKDYNPLKKPEGAEGPSDDEEDHEGLALKNLKLFFFLVIRFYFNLHFFFITKPLIRSCS